MNAWLDGVMGVVVGDALGSPAQFRDRTYLKRNPITKMEYCECFDMEPGCWTDDSSLTLATLDSLKKRGDYDLFDIAENFVDWLYNGNFTPTGFAYDIGNGCRSGIQTYYRTKDPMHSGSASEQNNGNGSLMRIMPICIHMYYEQRLKKLSDDACVMAVEEVSGITHGHTRAKMACGIYYFCVKEILDWKHNDDSEDTDWGLESSWGSKQLNRCLQRGIKNAFDYYDKDILKANDLIFYNRILNLDELKKAGENSIRSTGYVVDSIEAALWCVATTISYRDCMVTAVNLGGDADTIAAIAGGLAGLFYGYENIPEEWLEVIKKREWIEEMCGRF